jgi:hypothetical protein
MTACVRLWLLCGIIGLLSIGIMTGCTPDPQLKKPFKSAGQDRRAKPFPEPSVIVDVERVREATGGKHKVHVFGPFDLANVRRDYSSCDDGLGGALRMLSGAQAVTGGTAVTESRTPGTVAEVVAIVARMPGVNAANLVRDGRVSCGHQPGRPTAIRLADGSQTPAIRLNGGTPTDPLGAFLLTSKVGPDVVVVLVAFNGDQPDSDVIQIMVDTHHHATDLLQP